MNKYKHNVFTDIIYGKIKCKEVYSDDNVLAFYDINPQAEIHVLVIPKGNYCNFQDFIENASNEIVLGFFKTINKIIYILQLEENGYKLITNQGIDGGQEIDHFHMHILGGKKLK
ncbi:MAG: HIT domain-containing protein [Anaplasmataceae bacterium]|nr:HIT domain-containing protein [Anaplasmataceae bacterium]